MKEEEMLRLLRSMLEAEKTRWVEEGGWLRFRLKHDGMLWETACTPCADGLLFFGRFPFRCRDAETAWRVCGEANRELVSGALFLTEDASPVYRCRAVLDDVYYARERIASALQGSAKVIARFWGRLSRI